MEIRELDFSMFHPLDHWPFTRECASHYGGWRQHLHLAWEYRWKQEICSWTLCKIGKHKPSKWTRPSTGETGIGCWNCAKEVIDMSDDL